MGGGGGDSGGGDSGEMDASTTLKFRPDSTGWEFTNDSTVSASPASGVMVCADWWSNEGVTWAKECG